MSAFDDRTWDVGPMVIKLCTFGFEWPNCAGSMGDGDNDNECILIVKISIARVIVVSWGNRLHGKGVNN